MPTKVKTVKLRRHLTRLRRAANDAGYQRSLAKSYHGTITRQAETIKELRARVATLETIPTRNIIAARTRLLFLLEGLQTELLSLIDEVQARG